MRGRGKRLPLALQMMLVIIGRHDKRGRRDAIADIYRRMMLRRMKKLRRMLRRMVRMMMMWLLLLRMLWLRKVLL